MIDDDWLIDWLIDWLLLWHLLVVLVTILWNLNIQVSHDNLLFSKLQLFLHETQQHEKMYPTTKFDLVEWMLLTTEPNNKNKQHKQHKTRNKKQ
jgi:hypothetical protein